MYNYIICISFDVCLAKLVSRTKGIILIFLSVFFCMCVAACYDCRNHCVWTCNDDWIDIWDCAGKVKAAAHQLASRLGKNNIKDLIPPVEENQENSHSTIHVSEAITLMLRHIGIESCRLVPGFEFSTTVVHSLPLSFLEQCCDLLECSLEEKSWANALAVTITLQVHVK